MSAVVRVRVGNDASGFRLARDYGAHERARLLRRNMRRQGWNVWVRDHVENEETLGRECSVPGRTDLLRVIPPCTRPCAARRVRKGPGSRASHPPLGAGPCVACTGLVAARRKAKRTATTKRANTRPSFAKREGLSAPSFVGRKTPRRSYEVRAPHSAWG